MILWRNIQCVSRILSIRCHSSSVCDWLRARYFLLIFIGFIWPFCQSMTVATQDQKNIKTGSCLSRQKKVNWDGRLVIVVQSLCCQFWLFSWINPGRLHTYAYKLSALESLYFALQPQPSSFRSLTIVIFFFHPFYFPFVLIKLDFLFFIACRHWLFHLSGSAWSVFVCVVFECVRAEVLLVRMRDLSLSKSTHTGCMRNAVIFSLDLIVKCEK